MKMLVNGVPVNFDADHDDLCLVCELILHLTEIHHAQLHITACSRTMIVLYEAIMGQCPGLLPSISRIYG